MGSTRIVSKLNLKTKPNRLSDQSGQSTVEYILLLAVVASLFFTFANSRAFKDFFGDNSTFFNAIAERIALDYRHATIIETGGDISPSPSGDHPSFANATGGSRFFGHQSEYPGNP